MTLRSRWNATLSLAAALIVACLAVLVALVGRTDAAQLARNAGTEGDRLTVELGRVNGSEINGEAVVRKVDGASVISVTVTGPEGASFLPDLRRGTCKKPAHSPEVPLALAAANEPVETTVDLDFDDLLEGRYVIEVHQFSESLTLDPASAVACGRIVAKRDAESTIDQPPATGVGIPVPRGINGVVSIVLAVAACSFAAVGLRFRPGKPLK